MPTTAVYLERELELMMINAIDILKRPNRNYNLWRWVKIWNWSCCIGIIWTLCRTGTALGTGRGGANHETWTWEKHCIFDKLPAKYSCKPGYWHLPVLLLWIINNLVVICKFPCICHINPKQHSSQLKEAIFVTHDFSNPKLNCLDWLCHVGSFKKKLKELLGTWPSKYKGCHI